MRNPKAKPFRVLGFTLGQWTALLAILEAHLTANEHLQELPEAAARALNPAFADDRVWNQMKAELGV